MEHDRQQIGLTPQSQDRLRAVMEKGWFNEAQDAARFAMAYAIRAGVSAGQTPGVQTRWNASLFDETGEIAAVVTALHPGLPPVRTMEHFVNEGLRLIHTKLVDEARTPADLLI